MGFIQYTWHQVIGSISLIYGSGSGNQYFEKLLDLDPRVKNATFSCKIQVLFDFCLFFFWEKKWKDHFWAYFFIHFNLEGNFNNWILIWISILNSNLDLATELNTDPLLIRIRNPAWHNSFTVYFSSKKMPKILVILARYFSWSKYPNALLSGENDWRQSLRFERFEPKLAPR
jgi:hypothetical protein